MAARIWRPSEKLEVYWVVIECPSIPGDARCFLGPYKSHYALMAINIVRSQATFGAGISEVCDADIPEAGEPAGGFLFKGGSKSRALYAEHCDGKRGSLNLEKRLVRQIVKEVKPLIPSV